MTTPRRPTACDHDDRQHHARGLCHACYMRQRYGVGRWPTWLTHCVCCGSPKGRRSYRGHGLCWACYQRAEDHTKWRLETLKQRIGQYWMNQALLEVIQTRGIIGTARALGVECVDVRRWVRTPINPNPAVMPKAVAVAVVTMWQEVQG